MRLPEKWKPLGPGVVGTALGLSVSIATYIWVFEPAQCGDVASLSCRVNANQGIIALLGIALGVIAIWTTVLTRTADDRRTHAKEEEDFEQHLSVALGEARHNLIHYAMSYDEEDKLTGIPQFETDMARKLSDPKFSSKITNGFRASLSASIRMGDLASRVLRLPPDRSTPDTLEAYIQAMLALLNSAICEQPGHPAWLHDDPILRDMQREHNADAVCVFRASQAEKDLPRIRTRSLPVFCWIQDADLDGAAVYDIKQRARDYQIDYRAKRGTEAR
jgi:hypothetical protein